LNPDNFPTSIDAIFYRLQSPDKDIKSARDIRDESDFFENRQDADMYLISSTLDILQFFQLLADTTKLLHIDFEHEPDNHIVPWL
jgi:hypothetical protein